jgi:hypothetical protein
MLASQQPLRQSHCLGREKAQLGLLVGAARASAGVPFQRLPALPALFLAEAAAALAHPGTPLYAPVNKQLLRGRALDLQV